MPSWTRNPLALSKSASTLLMKMGIPLVMPLNWNIWKTRICSLIILVSFPAPRLHMLDWIAQHETRGRALSSTVQTLHHHDDLTWTNKCIFFPATIQQSKCTWHMIWNSNWLDPMISQDLMGVDFFAGQQACYNAYCSNLSSALSRLHGHHFSTWLTNESDLPLSCM